MFDSDSVCKAPSSRSFGRDLFEEIDGVFIPASKHFDDERLEEDTLRATILKVSANLGGFPGIYGGRRCVGCAMK